MGRGGFEIMNHIGSIIIVGVTILICFFCLILQLCKRLTRKRDEETLHVQLAEPKKPGAETNDQEPNNSIGWNTSVMDSKDDFTSTQFPVGFNPTVLDKRTNQFDKMNEYDNRMNKCDSKTNEYDNRMNKCDSKTNEYDNKINEYDNRMNDYHSPYVESKNMSGQSNAGVKRQGRQFTNEPERVHPGFKDEIVYGGPRREVGWSKDT